MKLVCISASFLSIIMFPVMLAALLPVMAVVGAIRGLWRGLSVYFYSIRYNLDLHKKEMDKSDEPAELSYFFRLAFRQYLDTVRYAFSQNAQAVIIADNDRDKMLYRDDMLGGIVRMPLRISSKVYLFVEPAFAFFSGLVFCTAFGLINGAVLLVISCGYYLLLGVVWLIDKAFISTKKIASQCPNCHRRIALPAFSCPKCNERFHKKLAPGKYGIFTHTCECGEQLGSVFFTGRYELDAFCPYCFSALTAADARPFVIHLVGGTASGKTVYLVSLYHELRERMKKVREGAELTIPRGYEDRFSELADWFRGVDHVPNTVEFTAQSYPMILDHPGLDLRRQLMVYDIAGEAISGKNRSVNMVSLKNCDGIFLMADPFCSEILCRKTLERGEELPEHCTGDLSVMVDDLVNFLVDLRAIKVGERCRIPMAVLITKSDRLAVRERLGPEVLKDMFSGNPAEDTDKTRDEECRSFLSDIGLGSVLLKLDGQFTDVHFYPVSSMGHEYDGSSFKPWGVMQPLDKMLGKADAKLEQILSGAEQA